MSRVTFQNVTKRYSSGERPAVDSFNLEIEEGELLVLVGPSGCGKSTTLRLVAGLESPDSGEILIGERNVNDVLPRDRNVAMIFQNYALYPHMTVFDNIAFPLRMRRVDASEVDRRVRAAATTLDIEAVLDRRPAALSGGQRQRVAIGRAIVREPAVFLFDEPLSNLDAKMRVTMRREIRDLHDKLGVTLLYVTHDQVEAMTLGDRIAIIHEGRLQQVGAPQEVYDRPANLFVAGFIGSPPMNLIPGDHEELRMQTPRGASFVVGVRPEAMTAAREKNDAADAVRGIVESIERLGNETLLHLHSNDLRWAARAPAHHDFKIDDAVFLNFSPDSLHIFDAATGDRKET